MLFALQPLGIVLIIVISLLAVLVLVGVSYVKAPPNTAFIITGPFKQRTLIGRAGFRIPGLERVDKIPLSLIQVDIKTASAVPTKEFINIFVDGVHPTVKGAVIIANEWMKLFNKIEKEI